MVADIDFYAATTQATQSPTVALKEFPKQTLEFPRRTFNSVVRIPVHQHSAERCRPPHKYYAMDATAKKARLAALQAELLADLAGDVSSDLPAITTAAAQVEVEPHPSPDESQLLSVSQIAQLNAIDALAEVHNRVQTAQICDPNPNNNRTEQLKTDGSIFSTGKGNSIKITEAQRARAMSLFDDDPPVSARMPSATEDQKSTPDLRRQLLKSRLQTVSAGTGGANNPHDSGHKPFQQSRLGNSTRKRTVFVTPRSITRAPLNSAGSTPGSGVSAGSGVLHPLKISLLKQTLHSAKMGETAAYKLTLPVHSKHSTDVLLRSTSSAVGTPSWQSLYTELKSLGGKYATEAWVILQYRWIIHKLTRLSLFYKVPDTLLVTREIVMDELKYKYEREFNRGNRPVLKAILQHDAPAGAPMVALVASLVSSNMIELTDGWYRIHAQCDDFLSKCLSTGKIYPGQKIRICGAELVSSGPGEAIESANNPGTYLKLYTNGTKPVAATTRLGALGNRKATILPLGIVKQNGGIVPKTVCVIKRIFPRLIQAKMPSGVSVFMTEKRLAESERRAQNDVHNAHSRAEEIVQERESQRCAQWLHQGKPGGMSHIERLYAAVRSQPAGMDDVFNSLNSTDQKSLRNYLDSRNQELRIETMAVLEEILTGIGCRPLSTMEVLPVLVGEVRQGGGNGVNTDALMCVKRPPEGLVLREGDVFSVTGLEARNLMRDQGGGACDRVTQSLHVATTPTSQWKRMASSAQDLPSNMHCSYSPSVRVSIANLQSFTGTFDFVGVLLGLGPTHIAGTGYPCQTLYLGDETSCEWSLAVELHGPEDSIDWLDEGDIFQHITLNNVVLVGSDPATRVMRAAGDLLTSILKMKERAPPLHGAEHFQHLKNLVQNILCK